MDLHKTKVQSFSFIFFCVINTIVNSYSELVELNAELDLNNLENQIRVKRANVEAISHLYDESRVSNHTQEEKDAILERHNYYRSRTDPEASNMEYMVSRPQVTNIVVSQIILFGNFAQLYNLPMGKVYGTVTEWTLKFTYTQVYGGNILKLECPFCEGPIPLSYS